MKRFYPFLWLALFATPSFCLGASPQPNIVFILADDLAWSDLGCYGHSYHRTPNIDRLAKEGMRFTDAYSPAPICSAARASILTGKAVPRVGFEFVTKNNPGQQELGENYPLQSPPFTLNLPLSETTIAETLGPLGYQTAFFGKWHVSQHYNGVYQAWHPEFAPSKQGFDVAVEDFGAHPYGWTQAEKEHPEPTAEGLFAADTLVQKTIDFVASKHHRPYFLFASSFYVHTPVKNRCRWLVDEYESRIPADAPKRNQRLEYAAFLETFDHHVGRLLQAIDDSGQRSNTLVVFLSDNGGHPEFTSNAPLRGSKWNLYEGGIRVPMLVRWPGKVAAASQCDTPVIGYDLLPTFVDIAGGTSGEHRGLDGINLRPLFENADLLPSRNLVWHFPYYHPESGFAKAIDTIGVDDFAVSKTRPQSAMRRGDLKIIYFDEDQRSELYDLNDDLAEQRDLSDAKPALTARLTKELQQTLDQMHARRAMQK
ncbi:sulfatase [Novipirellula artificiosorum]|uniref:Arylsulfatase n=1 Tax=Novipirellula artificiosorum TaxID=2528016 RepID=A0A5C6E3V8_9BACT|nr:sulfatase [Novipirellula artificiosorum]TWU42126.1 Arylsulfatase [Novipirellula artificiosorum]